MRCGNKNGSWLNYHLTKWLCTKKTTKILRFFKLLNCWMSPKLKQTCPIKSYQMEAKGTRPFCQLDISSTWHFIYWTFCLLHIFSPWHIFTLKFCQLEILSTFFFLILEILLTQRTRYSLYNVQCEFCFSTVNALRFACHTVTII